MYNIVFTEKFKKELSKLDKQTAKIILHWINKNINNTLDPRIHGKELKGKLKGIWRYRVGDYRIFATIKDKLLIVFLFDIEHRKDIYK
ncbi:MAG: type II toxin-antitoxin system RelE/ParE family toxin [Lachnospiraceae bacterium]|nr:type II toxin-antitoxin system RelE/ParE family toxin [Lachnospiraceae bacterium]